MNASHIILIRFVPVACLASIASAQGVGIPVFSIDWNGPTIGLPDSFTGFPITEGDLLMAQPLLPALGPLPTPGITESAGPLAPFGLNLGQYLPCFGHPAYTQCLLEVDALSHAMDAQVTCVPGSPVPHWAFSTNFRGMGNASAPLPPTIWTEAPCQDEAADVWIDLGVGCGPLPPGPVIGHTGYIDGDGIASCAGFLYPGTGLQEFAPPSIHGDNLDALDDDVPDLVLPRSTCTYFSLDAAFLDPFLGVLNSGSAAAHGFVGGDVLMTCATSGCGPALYASAIQLGLDIGGTGTDDLDAIALRENGVAGYQRSTVPFDWTAVGGSDMLFFSVRRGSMIIGTLDAFFGQPISESDILVPTGPLGSPPGIWIAGESLGLFTARGIVGALGDDLDALDVLQPPQPGVGFCFGDGSGTACPCGNFGFTGRGCGNNTNSLGGLLWANGTPSISNDTVHFTVSGLPSSTFALLFQGPTPLVGTVLGDGLRCVGGGTTRLMTRQMLCGNREFGWGVPGDPLISVVGSAVAFTTIHYQVYYRDAATFCTPAPINWTNGYSISWSP